MILKAPPRPFTGPMLAKKPKPRQTREEWIDQIFSVYKEWYAQPKLDGIRCVLYNRLALSRKMLQIPNEFIRYTLVLHLCDGTDGEIVTYYDSELKHRKPFHEIQSDVMSADGEPYFTYTCFDYAPIGYLEKSFELRYKMIANLNTVEFVPLSWYRTLHELTYKTKSKDDFFLYEKMFISWGYEGVILRRPESQYWCGPNRPTLKQGSLVAVTAWQTAEAVVIGINEQQTNINTVNRDAFGRVKRSKSVSANTGAAMVGTLQVRDLLTGKEFPIAGCISEQEKIAWWDNPTLILGKTVTYKYKPYGEKDLPRQPIYLGIRRDL